MLCAQIYAETLSCASVEMMDIYTGCGFVIDAEADCRFYWLLEQPPLLSAQRGCDIEIRVSQRLYFHLQNAASQCSLERLTECRKPAQPLLSILFNFLAVMI